MVIRDISDIEKVQNFISQNEYLAFDIETTGLQPRTDKVIGFGVSNGVEGFYVVHYEWIDNELVEVVPYNVCREILELLKHRKWTGWNSSFEVRFIRHYFNVELVNSLWSEGMLAAHLLDENRRTYRLKDIAVEVFGASATDEQKLMKESIKANGGDPKCDYYMADADIMGNYCIVDCLLTFRLNEKYVAELKAQNLDKFFFSEEVMPMYTNVVINMEDKGVKVDTELLKNTLNDLVTDLDNIHRRIQKAIAPDLDDFTSWYLNKELPPKRTGEFAQYICKFAELTLSQTKSGKLSLTKKNLEELPDSIYKTFLLGGDYLTEEIVRNVQELWLSEQPDQFIFNISSKHHLKRLFFTKLNETPVSKTDKGNPQVDQLFLNNMSDKYEWVKDLIVYNNLMKKKSTYIEKYLNDSIEGFFYPSWFMHRTTSGRLGGNLMQMPRQLSPGSADPLIIKYNNVIRDCIISGDGYKLVGADYASLEVVVFADDAGDKTLLDMIRNNEDFYSKVCIDVNNLHDKYSASKTAPNFFKTFEPDMRQDAKSYSLGLRYNMQSFALSKTLDISQKAAQDIIDKYFKAYPALKLRMDELIESAKTKGYVKSKTGRVRHLPMLKKLAASHGDSLLDSLDMWKKYHDCPKKYSQMKYLGSQYKSAVNNCLNFPIQSLAASITNRACIAIQREFNRLKLDAYICMQLHDEVVVRCKNKDVKRVSKTMKFLMENITKLSVPLNADPEVGEVYGEIK
jgi:DNA polymerase I-like protein with 3'-5' exonuclease and polymerase domains